MKKTVLAIAALAAFAGAAFAGEPVQTTQPTACIQTNANVKLDCVSTGSVEARHSAVNPGSAEAKTPRLGIEVNPWIMPSSF
ncbi:DUF680 domain-containing protein [Mesorhizobium sp. BE184]|uniref:DUF680 domain-containing protein n=1 Tax=Mesorhizobium sp. BE184 TaxID=2817714 RepID=UPI002861B7C3|nr:DUF680 domain-containing protein [Mesorhizobium sp. BE184]MDR7034564.1 hypothetical protein [Mesorhizobium sp. BE184]